jgi:hypothetical protein
LLDLTTIVPATAYHHRSYAERYSRYRDTTKKCNGPVKGRITSYKSEP